MNATEQLTYICTDCDLHGIGSKYLLPTGWRHTKLSGYNVLLCNDCLGTDYSINELERPNITNINAVAMPVQKSVAVFFDEGRINFTLEESEAIVTALNEANTLLRAKHPTQQSA